MRDINIQLAGLSRPFPWWVLIIIAVSLLATGICAEIISFKRMLGKYDRADDEEGDDENDLTKKQPDEEDELEDSEETIKNAIAVVKRHIEIHYDHNPEHGKLSQNILMIDYYIRQLGIDVAHILDSVSVLSEKQKHIMFDKMMLNFFENDYDDGLFPSNEFTNIDGRSAAKKVLESVKSDIYPYIFHTDELLEELYRRRDTESQTSSRIDIVDKYITDELSSRKSVEIKSFRQQKIDKAKSMRPKDFYKILTPYVYKQDEYCRTASVILYNHLHGNQSINIVSGPSGCGKTYLWEMIREHIYPNVIIMNAGVLTKSGYKGINISQSFAQVDFNAGSDTDSNEGIIVFDEFDKMITHENQEAGWTIKLQGEFLKLFDEGIIIDQGQEGTIYQSTKNMTFILCGSFTEKAAENAEKSSTNIGFGGTITKHRAFEKQITMDDIIEFGLLREIAGRVTEYIAVDPLTIEDYIYFVKDFGNSAIKQVEKLYHLPVELTEEEIREIAQAAYKDELGLRKAIQILKNRMNQKIFEQNGVNDYHEPDHLSGADHS